LIYEGVVDVEIDQKFVKRLAKGAIFGELALLFKCSRRASIICKSPVCRFLIMKPANYKNALKKMKID
jgi:CRP-like cAMP-binding protein